jgi:integrase
LTISEEQIRERIKSLKPTKNSKGRVVTKTKSELRYEAKVKLTNRLCIELTPAYSLYALRHSWATRALMKGVDPLTVGILMGHKDPSMLSRVYQHLSLSVRQRMELWLHIRLYGMCRRFCSNIIELRKRVRG